MDDSQDVGLDDGGAGVGAGGDSRGRLSPRGIDLEALVEEEVAEAMEDVALVQQVEETAMHKAIVQYHQRLPKAIQLRWLSNLKVGSRGFHRRPWQDARGLGVQRQRHLVALLHSPPRALEGAVQLARAPHRELLCRREGAEQTGLPQAAVRHSHDGGGRGRCIETTGKEFAVGKARVRQMAEGVRWRILLQRPKQAEFATEEERRLRQGRLHLHWRDIRRVPPDNHQVPPMHVFSR